MREGSRCCAGEESICRERVALFFYALVFVFMYLPLTQGYVNLPVGFIKTIPPWVYVGQDHHAVNPLMNDIVLQIVPWAHRVRESWRALEIPLWNPTAACGYPLLANGQSAALSPLRILGLPLSLGHAMTFEAAMKILTALTFMFLFCRRRGYSQIAAVFGGVAFGFSTFVIVWLHFPMAATASLVPAVFYCVDLLAERRTAVRFAATAAVWAAMMYSGHPETVSHTIFFTGLYALWIAFVERDRGGASTDSTGVSAEGTRGRFRFLMTLAATIAVGVLLAAPLLLPFAEAVPKSKRFNDSGRIHRASTSPSRIDLRPSSSCFPASTGPCRRRPGALRTRSRSAASPVTWVSRRGSRSRCMSSPAGVGDPGRCSSSWRRSWSWV